MVVVGGLDQHQVELLVREHDLVGTIRLRAGLRCYVLKHLRPDVGHCDEVRIRTARQELGVAHAEQSRADHTAPDAAPVHLWSSLSQSIRSMFCTTKRASSKLSASTFASTLSGVSSGRVHVWVFVPLPGKTYARDALVIEGILVARWPAWGDDLEAAVLLGDAEARGRAAGALLGEEIGRGVDPVRLVAGEHVKVQHGADRAELAAFLQRGEVMLGADEADLLAAVEREEQVAGRALPGEVLGKREHCSDA